MKDRRLVIAAWIALASIQGAMCGERPAASPAPDPGFQSRIEQAVVAIVRQDDAAAERIEALREHASGRRGTLLLQLALYLKEAGGTEQSMAGALIFHRLEFTSEEKLDAILPHLDAAEPGLRRVFTDLLSTIDRPDGGEPDFRFYEARIARTKDSPPPALIRYLYEVSPDAAVLSMARIYRGGMELNRDAAAGKLSALQQILARGDRPAGWSAEDRAEARAALESLSRDPSWWMRYYVAAILNRNRDLSTQGVMDRLRDDPDPLVRGVFPE